MRWQCCMTHITRVLLPRMTRLSTCLCHIRTNKRLATLINLIAVLLDDWIHESDEVDETHDTHPIIPIPRDAYLLCMLSE